MRRRKVVLSLVCFWLAWLTSIRVAVFRSNLTVWTEAVSVAWCSGRAHANLARALKEAGQIQAYSDHFGEAMLIGSHQEPRCESK